MAEGRASAVELPPKIGRHVVLGYLATGGMAEIFLGKEPSGRPVVIKRILPHLARQGNFVSMFVDEARIGSLVHHPNVVEVYELGQVGTDLFMVMEYLGGESVSGMMRRLVSRREQLPLPLAAYVVAEACAGLQAAHELRDDVGKPLGLVHRDISPSNIFITYGGDVKVLDFGIATAAHRLTRTATGQVKGKFSYMSPEQCRGETLDLRSDIFSLGIVLYELTTQRRLFKRPNELMVLKAVTEDPIPRPRREVRGYPEVLEAICMKALARDPDRRHASALELRAELLAAMTDLGFEGDPGSALATGMETLFAERIVEKRQMLSHVRAGTDLVVPAAEVDENVEVPQVEEHSGTPSIASIKSPAKLPVAERSGRGWLVLFVLLVIAGGGAALWYFVLREPEVPPIQTARPALAVTPIDPAPRVDAPDAGFVVRVDTSPSGAKLVVDGEYSGTTPVELRIERTRDVDLQIELPGYAVVHQQLAFDHAQSLLIPLVAAAPAPPDAAVPPRHDPKRPKPKPDPKDPFQRFD